LIASIQGILVTLLCLGVLIAIHESGHFLAAKSIKVPVRQFAIGFGPRIFGFTWGETECRLNWIPLGGYCAFVDDERGEDGEPLPGVTDDMLLRNRAIWQRTWVVSAGVIFNFVSAWLILFGSNLGLGVPTGHQTVGIKDVLPNTPAAAVGLKAGDRVVSVEHQPFKDFMAFRTRLGESKQKPIAIGIMRDGKPVDVTVTPDAKGLIGFKPTVGDERRPVTGPVEAVTMATNQQLETTGMLCSALYQLFTSPGSMMDKTGGPVQIVAMGDQIYQDDPWKLLTFAVLLSIELAIINLLPLPALDGGHLVLLLLEKLRGRALPRRLEERILVAGFVMIMGLGMLLIVKDILTVPGMYHQAPVATPSK
jgi:membrane-associated protease RseP (regulator of RpoE activity)